jgi:hypothetical protein
MVIVFATHFLVVSGWWVSDLQNLLAMRLKWKANTLLAEECLVRNLP